MPYWVLTQLVPTFYKSLVYTLLPSVIHGFTKRCFATVFTRRCRVTDSNNGDSSAYAPKPPLGGDYLTATSNYDSEDPVGSVYIAPAWIVWKTASNSSSVVACVSVVALRWFGYRGKVFTEPLPFPSGFTIWLRTFMSQYYRIDLWWRIYVSWYPEWGLGNSQRQVGTSHQMRYSYSVLRREPAVLHRPTTIALFRSNQPIHASSRPFHLSFTLTIRYHLCLGF